MFPVTKKTQVSFVLVGERIVNSMKGSIFIIFKLLIKSTLKKTRRLPAAIITITIITVETRVTQYSWRR